MLYLLKRHPIPIQAFFRHSLVLTYALPRDVLEPLLPPGLMLDTYGDLGFVAIAMVQTRDLRPGFLPRGFGQNFFLTGYRIFSRYTTLAGRRLRGLRILRSDTDKTLMALGGNLLTHYSYRKANVRFGVRRGRLEARILTPHAEADLHVVADLNSRPALLPPGSPFPDLETARHFAGPLPFTFDYEKETHSLVLIKGVRKKWDPQPVRVEVKCNTFFDHAPFRDAHPTLANAFYIENIPYRWERGRREALPSKVLTRGAA